MLPYVIPNDDDIHGHLLTFAFRIPMNYYYCSGETGTASICLIVNFLSVFMLPSQRLCIKWKAIMYPFYSFKMTLSLTIRKNWVLSASFIRAMRFDI